jgi:hypothetical protein
LFLSGDNFLSSGTTHTHSSLYLAGKALASNDGLAGFAMSGAIKSTADLTVACCQAVTALEAAYDMDGRLLLAVTGSKASMITRLKLGPNKVAGAMETAKQDLTSAAV